MTLPKPYKWKSPSSRRSDVRDINRVPKSFEEPELTGWVNGLPASDIEERFARGLRNNNRDFGYQVKIRTAFSLPDKDRNVDFMVDSGGLVQPVEVYGPLHQWPQAQLEDAEREAELNDAFEQDPNVLPLKIVWFHLLQDQQTANQAAINV